MDGNGILSGTLGFAFSGVEDGSFISSKLITRFFLAGGVFGFDSGTLFLAGGCFDVPASFA